MRYLRFTIFLVIILLGWPMLAGALTLSPLKIELQAAPGQTASGLVRLFNETAENLFLSLSVENFRPADNLGRPEFLPMDASQRAFLDWFLVPETSVVLTPGQLVEFPFLIAVPAVAEVGGYYGALFFQTEVNQELTSPIPPSADFPLQGRGKMGVSARVGTLVLLTVMGELEKKLELINFSVEKKFYSHLPVAFDVELKNSGNIHIRPEGKIVIKNWRGKAVDEIIFNAGGGHIFPGSSRVFEEEWGVGPVGELTPTGSGGFFNFWAGLKQEVNNFRLGRYRAEVKVNLTNDDSNKANDTRITNGDANGGNGAGAMVVFWVVPWRVMTAGMLLVILILAGVMRIRRRGR